MLADQFVQFTILFFNVYFVYLFKSIISNWSSQHRLSIIAHIMLKTLEACSDDIATFDIYTIFNPYLCFSFVVNCNHLTPTTQLCKNTILSSKRYPE